MRLDSVRLPARTIQENIQPYILRLKKRINIRRQLSTSDFDFSLSLADQRRKAPFHTMLIHLKSKNARLLKYGWLGDNQTLSYRCVFTALKNAHANSPNSDETR